MLDVGCGGSIDSILAAHRVGPQGRVIGVDILEEMLERARANAATAGVAERCQFLHGQMESIPLPDRSVDVAISNGVINLSPRKSRVLAELYRVLRPGGRFTVSDLILEEELPPQLTTSDAAWAGRIADAVRERVFVKKLTRAGFRDIEVYGRTPYGIDEVAVYPLFRDELIEVMRKVLPAERQRHLVTAVVARARRGEPF